MLVLTRRLGEQISLDDGRIILTVTQIRKTQVKIAIDCDRSIQIDRAEVVAEREADQLSLFEYAKIDIDGDASGNF